eukprot:CAMPEP_0184874122 /NCGR_PEP_ID=MMETSP0580-20130426/42220_1 /TAXON_ID=1118495 /ORGANISM="Dactyliosolen fragilissimus" /LENGTH=528 /DNA_ID=CAMNT_0027377097 /DNA_START=33 /DNA_END=1616 /DNA_ORIENTATION=+
MRTTIQPCNSNVTSHTSTTDKTHLIQNTSKIEKTRYEKNRSNGDLRFSTKAVHSPSKCNGLRRSRLKDLPQSPSNLVQQYLSNIFQCCGEGAFANVDNESYISPDMLGVENKQHLAGLIQNHRAEHTNPPILPEKIKPESLNSNFNYLNGGKNTTPVLDVKNSDFSKDGHLPDTSFKTVSAAGDDTITIKVQSELVNKEPPSGLDIIQELKMEETQLKKIRTKTASTNEKITKLSVGEIVEKPLSSSPASFLNTPKQYPSFPLPQTKKNGSTSKILTPPYSKNVEQEQSKNKNDIENFNGDRSVSASDIPWDERSNSLNISSAVSDEKNSQIISHPEVKESYDHHRMNPSLNSQISKQVTCNIPLYHTSDNLETFKPKGNKSFFRNVCSEPMASNYSVRGPCYMRDNLKVKSEEALFSLIGCDNLVYKKKTMKSHHVCSSNDSYLNRLRGVCTKVGIKTPFLLCLNFVVPWGNLLMYFCRPDTLGGGPFNESRNETPSENLWKKFVGSGTAYRNKKLKLIPRICVGPW